MAPPFCAMFVCMGRRRITAEERAERQRIGLVQREAHKESKRKRVQILTPAQMERKNVQRKARRKEQTEECGLTESQLYYDKNREMILEKARIKRERNPELHRKQGQGMVFAPGQTIKSMRAEQDNKCMICGIELGTRGKAQFAVDHCHETKKVRALLCSRHNTGLGLFGDSVEVLQQAIAYLQKFEKTAPC